MYRKELFAVPYRTTLSIMSRSFDAVLSRMETRHRRGAAR